MRALSVGFRLWPPVWVVLWDSSLVVMHMLSPGALGMHVWAKLELSMAASMAILEAKPTKIMVSNSALPLFRRIRLSGQPHRRLVASQGEGL